MATLQEIEAAIPGLNAAELAELENFVRAERRKARPPAEHGVLDIPPARVGRMLRPFPAGDDDLLGEMLQDRA